METETKQIHKAIMEAQTEITDIDAVSEIFNKFDFQTLGKILLTHLINEKKRNNKIIECQN